jgi:hypothetical protein
MRPARLLREHPRRGATARRIASLTLITAALAAAPAAATMAPAWSHSAAGPPASTGSTNSVAGRAPSVFRIALAPDTPPVKG